MDTTRRSVRYITNLRQVDNLSAAELARLAPVAEKFAFRTNDYYLGLIDWDDPDDPIRRLVVPDIQELREFGQTDASGEATYTVANGLEHKYRDTALLLVSRVCGAYCRFCFRKRLFAQESAEVVSDLTGALEYINAHPEINNVLLSGGDPLALSTRQLEGIICRLREIDHVKIIRIGTKMPAFNPYRILTDPQLPEMLARYSTQERKIFLIANFNHPRELTDVALQGLACLQKAGVATLSQSPVIHGVNDAPEVIADLFSRLSYNGVPPYYLFICRPTVGNFPFIVPVEECLDIFERAQRGLSGLARQARLCMSHKTGKVEVVGRIGHQIALRYHRAAHEKDRNRLMLVESRPEAYWLDDYFSGPPTDSVIRRGSEAAEGSSLRPRSKSPGGNGSADPPGVVVPSL
jgi:lysine 2,3-aminomutase